MGNHAMAALGEIARATADNPRWGHPSGVNAFYTLIHHGPVKIRAQLQQLGLAIFGTGEHTEGNFEGLDRIFHGLSCNDTAEYIGQEIKRRMEAAMGPRRAPLPPPITIQSLGAGTPALPPAPNNGTGMSPLGPFRKRNP